MNFIDTIVAACISTHKRKETRTHNIVEYGIRNLVHNYFILNFDIVNLRVRSSVFHLIVA